MSTRDMGTASVSRTSAKAFVLLAHPTARADRWPSVDRKVRIVIPGGRTLGFGDSSLAAWGDAARRLRSPDASK